MSLTIRSGVGIPPAGLIERFFGPMRSVLLVWRDVSRSVPVEITSWWRDPTRNVATGGAEYSQHLVGTAVDARSPGLTRNQLLVLAQRAASRYSGVTVPTAGSDTSGTSVHVQGLPTGFVRTIVTREPTLIASAQAFIGPARPIVAAPVVPRLTWPPSAAQSTGQPGGGFNY